VLFPYDSEKEFATKGKVPVRATFNGVPYAGSLIKYRNPLHMMGVLKSIREQIGKGHAIRLRSLFGKTKR